MTIRVFHCDDSAVFTRLVAFWLDEHSDIDHVGEAHSVAVALEMLPTARPDVVLLDTMSRPRDPALVNAIRAAAPNAKVIVYSGYVGVIPSAELGSAADAYLAKGEDARALVAAIRSVVGTDPDLPVLVGVHSSWCVPGPRPTRRTRAEALSRRSGGCKFVGILEPAEA